MTLSSSFCLLPKEVLWPFRFPWYRTQVTKATEKEKKKQNALQLFNTTRSAPPLSSTKGHNGAGHGLRGGFSNGEQWFHQSVWLHQRGPASGTDWSLHHLMPEDNRFWGFLEAPWVCL